MGAPLKRTKRLWLYYRSARVLSWLAISSFARRHVDGREHIPRSGPVILAANHQSYLDPLLVAISCRRILDFMARDSLFHNRVFGAILRYGNAFPVKRGQVDIAAFKHSIRVLKDGGALLLFPEATRTETGHIRAFETGAIALARKTRSSIVPVVIEGAHEVWPRDAQFPKPGNVWVTFCEPLSPEQLTQTTDDEAANRLTETLRHIQNEIRQRAGRPPIDYAPTIGPPSEAGQEPPDASLSSRSN